ncbi:acyl carrier protein [Streptomyces sp. NBC_01005]|uniref:acyl carrier protein n=1 Tax=unclassified Streptomyces TaxID=2593676 RepID=UPI002E332A66|nr:acyl carrier protein [Streptomyces sp. NBC_01362]WSW03106.1 acyl carrier protein [Streptomyces sp. NBC_01005]WTC92612.1 acyl carrier protein [Streptomyces sp. NBC_01650]
MNSVEELCSLISSRITWGRGEDPQSLNADTPLLEMGLVDSLAIMEIVTALDKEAGITLPDTEIVAANFRTPKALLAAIENLTGEVGK